MPAMRVDLINPAEKAAGRPTKYVFPSYSRQHAHHNYTARAATQIAIIDI